MPLPLPITGESLGIPQTGQTQAGGPLAGGQNPLAALLQQLSQGQTKNGTEVAPVMQTMTPAQAGGPAAQRQEPKPPMMQQPVTSQDRTLSAISAGIQGIGAGIRQAKQHKFEQDSAIARAGTLGNIAKEKLEKQGMKYADLSPQEQQAYKMLGNEKFKKKWDKIAEKAMTDPMSGGYVGIQQAHQQAQQAAGEQQERKEKLAKMMADLLYKQQVEKINQQNANTRQQGVDERAKAADAATEQKKVTAQNKLIEEGKIKGHNVTFDDKGNATSTPFTQEQINSDKGLKLQQAKEQAYTDAAIARAKQGAVRLQLEKERVAMQHKLLDLRAQHESKYTGGAGGGKGGEPKLNNQEQNRMDMAQIAQDYLVEMKEILERRKADSVDPTTGKQLPALFGKGSWLKNKMAIGMADQDPDAARWAVLTDLTKQPMVGMHFRSQNAMKDMEDMNSSFYRSPESVAARLDEELKGTQRIKETAGRPDGKMPGQIKAAPPTASKGKELTSELATQFLQQAGGDKDMARKIAKAKGYKF